MNNIQQLVVVAPRVITRDKDEKIKLIYESFSRLVNSEGYEKVTTRKIAEDAGISVGIIYHYFTEGKPEIAAGFWEESLNVMMDPIFILKGSDDDIKREIKLHLENHRKNEALYRAFDQAILEKKDLFEGLKRSRAELIETKIRANFTEINSPTQLSELAEKYLRVYGLVDALVHRHLFQAPFAKSDEELVHILSDLSLRILRKENES
jgi:AcrR family transcriptional regulator